MISNLIFINDSILNDKYNLRGLNIIYYLIGRVYLKSAAQHVCRAHAYDV